MMIIHAKGQGQYAVSSRLESSRIQATLAIDIGSSSTRALLYDASGTAIDGVVAQERYELRAAADGTSEDDPDAAIARIARCVDAVLSRAGPLASRIGAVAVDTFVSSLMALDSAGRPLTPLITYADTRNAADADALRASLDEREILDRTGCPVRSSYWPARLAWLRRVRPEMWRTVARWISLGEYLEARLFGHYRVTFSVASWSGLLDRRRLTWDQPLLGVLGVSVDSLSPLVDVDEPLQGLVDPYAARWPALRGVPWFPAVGDGAAANVGSGCTDHSRVALTVGTTGAMRVVQAEVEQVPAGLWCYRLDRRHALLGGATSEGGNVYAWLCRTHHLPDAAETEVALAALQPDSHGLTVLPFFAGERSPDWAGNVQATIHGLTFATTPLQILRASLEAIAYRFAVIEQRLCSKADCRHRLVASGHALLQSPAWMQIVADVTGRHVVATAEQEATSRGAAVLALRALGVLPSIEETPAADGAIYEPDDARHAVYQAAIARQRRLYDRLIG